MSASGRRVTLERIRTTLERVHLEIERDVVGKTLSYFLRGDLVIYAAVRGMTPSDFEWRAYVQWLKKLMRHQGYLKGLVLPGERAPSPSQRSHFNSEVVGDMTLAVVMNRRHLLPIVKIFTWFVPNTRAFGADEIEQALAYLSVPSSAELLDLIRKLQHSELSRRV